MKGQEGLLEVEEALRVVNQEAAIVRSERCRIDLGQILDRATFSPDQAATEARDRLAETSGRAAPISSGAHSRRAVSSHSHRHDSQIRTLRLVLPGYVDMER